MVIATSMLNGRRISPGRSVRFIAHDASHGMRETAESEPHRGGTCRVRRLMDGVIDTKGYGGEQDEHSAHEQARADAAKNPRHRCAFRHHARLADSCRPGWGFGAWGSRVPWLTPRASNRPPLRGSLRPKQLVLRHT